MPKSSPRLEPADTAISMIRVEPEVPLPCVIDPVAKTHLRRMFRDPSVLEPHEKESLVAHLREAVALAPETAELRVLLGMALCVNLDVQAALEELRTSVALAPDSFIAHLKFGELLMRLRICSQAEEETRLAAKLATNPVQSELARRQAATLRTMLREGVERGGYGGFWSRVRRLAPRFSQGERSRATALPSPR